MDSQVLDFHEIGSSRLALVGGKAAGLGELSRIEGISVPPGFCVTTEVFRRALAQAPAVAQTLARLQSCEARATDGLSAELRAAIEGLAIPLDAAAAITARLCLWGERQACAVRSSATAEDLPGSSFAGLQDSFLNIVGVEELLRCVRRCWASLYSERALAYRRRRGFAEEQVGMAVVIQQMVQPCAAGVLFTADPATSNRRVSCIEGCLGLGEGLVAGLVSADVYRVREGAVTDMSIATKATALRAKESHGTEPVEVARALRDVPVLTDAQAIELARLGRLIEDRLGAPQDIEWCLGDDGFQILQSRAITTLFPIPRAEDTENRVYVSVGHQQMMTDPMKALGLSLFQLTARPPMHEAAGRLFVDVTARLGAPASRDAVIDALGRSDPLIGDALQQIADRGDFIRPLSDETPAAPPPQQTPEPIATDPEIPAALIERTEASIEALERNIEAHSGTALLDFILDDIQELKRLLFEPLNMQVIVAGMEAAWWLNAKLEDWLDEQDPADVLTQAAPHNVTAEMGLALLEVADEIRPHPDVVAFLRQVDHEDFLSELPARPGGVAARAAIASVLDRYGMRCAGEIDITRPRWSERPTTLLPMILDNVANFTAGEAERRLARGRQAAAAKEQELLARLRELPDGEQKADDTRRAIERLRTFAGYREYPKYGIVRRYWIYKRALLAEAERMRQAGVLEAPEDIFHLSFSELREAVCDGHIEGGLIARRSRAHAAARLLTPPRVITSEGEILTGSYRRTGLPAGALVGLGVSAGTVEGRARIVHDLGEAELEPQDILVTTYTDPSWTPLFVAIRGLVTEVGGLMTHGAVIAREYGLPAVVGVEHATRLIEDGRRIRLDGGSGYVELLD